MNLPTTSLLCEKKRNRRILPIASRDAGAFRCHWNQSQTTYPIAGGNCCRQRLPVRHSGSDRHLVELRCHEGGSWTPWPSWQERTPWQKGTPWPQRPWHLLPWWWVLFGAEVSLRRPLRMGFWPLLSVCLAAGLLKVSTCRRGADLRSAPANLPPVLRSATFDAAKRIA